jgi:hypothetical protein
LVAEKVFLLMLESAVIQVSSSSPKALAYFGGEDPDALKGMRRDISSFLTAIEASAVLHRAQRETAKDGAVMATIAGYRHAHEAFDAGLASSHGKASAKIVATVAAIETLQPETGFSAKVTLRELAKLLRVASPTTAGARLEEAIDFGAIQQDDAQPTERGKPRYYKVVKPSTDIDASPGLGIFPPADEVEKLYIGGGGLGAKQTEQEGKAFKKKEI